MSVPDVLLPPADLPPAGAVHESAAAAAEPDRFSKEETLFLVDWDDTLLPTTYLAGHNLREDTEVIPVHFTEELASYSEVVAETIRQMRERGRVVIVTNAETGWIDMTCAKFLPALQSVLNEVEAVSARSMFEPLGFQSPSQWKEQMFAEKIAQHFGVSPNRARWNVVSMGDASHEREAIHKVSRTTGCLAKSLKFMERPDVVHLRQEHELIQSYLHQIVQHADPLDLCVHEL
jgi:hypothetical protein